MQGSGIGPTLYIVMKSDLHALSDLNDIMCKYADDTTLLVPEHTDTYCLCFYDLALWKEYSATIFNKFTACCNKCVKKFFGYRRMGSMTGILLDLSLPTVNTILHINT